MSVVPPYLLLIYRDLKKLHNFFMPSGIRRRKLAKSGMNNNIKRRAAKEKKKKYVYDNPIIEANWDPKLTVKQNYKKLGLAPETQKATGGTEHKGDSAEIKTQSKRTRTAKITTDADGNTKIEYEKEDDIDDPIVPTEAKTEVVRQLEELSRSRKQTQRHQSAEEVQWLSKLVAKHGDNYQAMQWDKKLNAFQHSQGELRRRIKKFLS